MFYRFYQFYYHYFSSRWKEIMKLLRLSIKPRNILLARLWSCSFDTLHRVVSRNLWYSNVWSNKLDTSRFQTPMSSTAANITPSYTLILFKLRSSCVKLDFIIIICTSSTRLRPLLMGWKSLQLLLPSTVLDLNIDGMVIAKLFNYSLWTIIYFNWLCRLLVLNINMPITKRVRIDSHLPLDWSIFS